MLTHHRIHLACSLILLFAAYAYAAPRVPGFFTDNMVLQRDKPVPVWGWAAPNEDVSVSFADQVKTATAGADGRWQLSLEPMPANTRGQILGVGENIKLQNVVVGDVWICSGQSNMEWSVQQSHDPKNEIANAANPHIRHMKIGHIQSVGPQGNVRAKWEVSHPHHTGKFTAVGYYFARRLHTELGVPIGLIGTNWGGTRIEPWTAPIGFQSVPQLQGIHQQLVSESPTSPQGRARYNKALDNVRQWLVRAEADIAAGKHPTPSPAVAPHGNHQSPTRLYNSMIHPLIPYAIRGAIWYQGESNGNEGDSYFYKKKALIEGWRQLWGQGPFPFYFVQLASFQESDNNPAGGDGWARIREAQRRTLSLENTGMAVIIDIGEARDIHPRNKQDVGARLAQWALAREYGKELVPSGPLYKSHAVEGSTIRLSFDYVGAGLMIGSKQGTAPTTEVKGGKLTHFAIAGEDKAWHWAEARIDGDTIVVSNPLVPTPVAVRYAYRMNPEGANLYNREGLPASPFRTDSW